MFAVHEDHAKIPAGAVRERVLPLEIHNHIVGVIIGHSLQKSTISFPAATSGRPRRSWSPSNRVKKGYRRFSWKAEDGFTEDLEISLVATNGEGREEALKGVFDIFVDLRAQAIFGCNHLIQEDL